MLHCTGKPIGELRTDRMYQNFILEVEWRRLKPKGNAGIFIWADDITARGQPFHRGIEVQVLENAYGDSRGHTTHGDIFPIHGARMTPINGRGGGRAFPTENRSKPSPKRMESLRGNDSRRQAESQRQRRRGVQKSFGLRDARGRADHLGAGRADDFRKYLCPRIGVRPLRRLLHCSIRLGVAAAEFAVTFRVEVNLVAFVLKIIG
jgi:hypothetical protein